MVDKTRPPKQAVIRERYSKTAPSYDELYRFEQYSKYSEVVWRIPPQGIVLDDGCGTALLLEYIHVHGLMKEIKYYLCLDITREMLEIAHKRERTLQVDFLAENVEADAEHLPLRDRSVDIVYSFTVMDLLEQPVKGIREAMRVSKSSVIYSILKIIPRLSIKLIGKYLGETPKDIIFLVNVRNIQSHSTTREPEL